jgi:hypothetical protein
MGGSTANQEVTQVAKEFHVATLVGGDGDGLHVFFDGGGDDLLSGAVVSEMNYLGTCVLEQPPEDVDGGVVTIEQVGGG